MRGRVIIIIIVICLSENPYEYSTPTTCINPVPYAIGCSEYNVAYADFDMEAGTLELSADMCQVKCTQTHGCEAWTYTSPDKQCYLVDVKGDLSTNIGAISGPKTCGKYIKILLYENTLYNRYFCIFLRQYIIFPQGY